MKSVLRQSSILSAQEKMHPSAQVREVYVEEPEDGSTPVRGFLTAIRKAYRNDCILLPPGVYPAPPGNRSLFIRALRPGTVTFQAQTGQPAIFSNRDVSIWLSGINLSAAGSDVPCVRMSTGSLILSNGHISGGIVVSGSSTSLYLESCHVDRSEVGVSLESAAKAEVWGSSISGCQVGIMAGEGSHLTLLHSCIEGSAGTNPESPGAGVHAESAADIHLAGNLFLDNQLGVHLIKTGPAEAFFNLFERQSICSLMMRGGGPLHLHGCNFREQGGTDFGHVTLENIRAHIAFCEFDASAGLDVESVGGGVDRENLPAQVPPRGKDDHFLAAVAEIHQVIGMSESKEIMETILHQAHAAIQRRERGLPVPPLRFHCIFEGPVGSGRRHAAQILAKALKGLGLLQGSGDVIEIQMEDLLTGALSGSDAVASAKGGVLMLHAPELLDRRDSRFSFARTREILRQVLEECGEDPILIFAGPRDSVRPVLCNAPETEEQFRATLHFSHPSPPEVAEMFAAQAAALNIQLTTKARIKILLSLHMMHDRRDRRFLNSGGVAKLLDAAQKRYYERCSRERNFELPMEAGDIDVTVEKLADAVLKAQPAFVNICPKCSTENPWVPALSTEKVCANCGGRWEAGWGIWKASSYLRMKTTDEEEYVPKGLPPRRNRLPLSV